MKKINVGIIGLGGRGSMLLTGEILQMEDVEVLAVCDEYEDRAADMAAKVKEKKGNEPLCTTDYREVLAIDEIEAVVISTAWEAHVEVAIAAMRAGKYAGMEVGGAYSVDDCWRLVHTSEETGVPCMLLENCCYGQREMMCLNMVKMGVMGEVVHCEGGYHHPLCGEITGGNERRHYRLRNYWLRNCENYPTHELGPIAKLLNINRGNRMLTLTSTASKSVGLHEYAVAKRGADDPISKIRFAQGDVITTVIRCAGGETITLTLDTSLPRYYSRGLTVHGTAGFYEEMTDSVYLEKDSESYEGGEFNWKPEWNNAAMRPSMTIRFGRRTGKLAFTKPVTAVWTGWCCVPFLKAQEIRLCRRLMYTTRQRGCASARFRRIPSLWAAHRWPSPILQTVNGLNKKNISRWRRIGWILFRKLRLTKKTKNSGRYFDRPLFLF